MSTIRLFTPLPLKLWRSVRIAYLRWWLSEIESQASHYAREPHHNPEQLAVWRLDAQAVRCRIITLEQQ